MDLTPGGPMGDVEWAHDEARRRQEEARYRDFFQKIADRLKSQGFDDPWILAADILGFSTAYQWVYYYAEFSFIPALREAGQLMFGGEDGGPFFPGPEASVAVVIRNYDAARNHGLFDFILEDRASIESELGELTWERERNGESRISVRLPNRTIHDSPDALTELEEWFVQTLQDFKGVFWRQLPTRAPWPRNLLYKRWSYERDWTVPAHITLEQWWEHSKDRVGVGIVILTAYRGGYEGTEEQEAHALAIRQEVLDALTEHRSSIESELGLLHWGVQYTDGSYRICAFLCDRTCFDDDAVIAETRHWIDSKVEEFKRVFQQVAKAMELHERH